MYIKTKAKPPIRWLCLLVSPRKLFSFVSSDLVDMSFKISVLKESCNDVLLKGGYGARVKAKTLVKVFYELFGQYHVADTQGGGDGFGKGIEVDDITLVRKRKQGILGLGGNRELGFKVVLYNISVVFA